MQNPLWQGCPARETRARCLRHARTDGFLHVPRLTTMEWIDTMHSFRIRPELHPNCRLWMYAPGVAGVFGDGKCRLLRAIATHGSLQKATREIGMSYRKAWADLRKAEECLGIPLLTRQRGGRAGGATTLTNGAQAVLAAYDAFHSEATAGIQTTFDRFIQNVHAASQSPDNQS